MPQTATPDTGAQTNAPGSATQAGTAPQTTPQQFIPADARPVSEVMKADSAKRAAEAAKNTAGTQPAAGTAPQQGTASSATPAAAQAATAPQTAKPVIQPPKPQAAMPKDDDWDLPENFNSKNAFVPIEADAD